MTILLDPPTAEEEHEAAASLPPGAMPPPPPVPNATPPPRPPRRRGRIAAAVLAGSLVAGAGGGAIARLFDGSPAGTTATITTVSTSTKSTAWLTVAQAAAKVEKSVVDITTDQAEGTGIVVTANGEVVTNAHVIEGAQTIHVTLPGESEARPAT